MFRNMALTAILATAVMLAGCGESSRQAPAAAQEGLAAPSTALSSEPGSESKVPAAADVGAKPGSLAEVNPNFARRDTSGDNKVSRDEFLAPVKLRFKRLDKNKDGVLVAAEMPKKANPKVFSKMDKDKNGKVTLAEVSAIPEANFAKLDANKDGFISSDEAPRPKPGK